MLKMVCVTLLGIWLVLTFVNQFNFSWAYAIRRLDLLSLIPSWTFFAPDPVVTDLRLCYRTVAVDGTTTDWEEIDPIGSRTLWSALWNPQKRITKGVSDMVRFVGPLWGEGSDPEALQRSVSYRCLRNHVIRTVERLRPGFDFCQFLVAETAGCCDVPADHALFQSGLIRSGSES